MKDEMLLSIFSEKCTEDTISKFYAGEQ